MTAIVARLVSRRVRWVWAAVLTLGLLGAAAPAGAQTARGLSLGLFDTEFTADATERGLWLGRADDAGADVVRLDIGWVAPDTRRRPARFDARDPGDPAYAFARADAAIVDASSRGLRVLASFTGAPRWAEGPGRPPAAPAGSWRPDPRALEDYGAALARRYSGAFPDPARPGRALPRVDAFQVWNEPNLAKYLSPQWRGGRTASPAFYRRMLNAFYRGVKSVRPTALVVAAGTAPFGDPLPGGRRIMPARFVRDLLCERQSGRRLIATRCPGPAHFDVFAHHPYSVGFPRRRAQNADDVSIPDIGKLTRILRAAERSGHALPRKRHRMWVTEVSYDSSPPDPDGVPAFRHADFLQQALYLLWKQGVDTVVWFLIRDQPPQPSFAATNQSGIYARGGGAKPAARAFRFPFVVEHAGRRSLRLWGRTPVAGVVVIERRRAGRWGAVRRVVLRRHATFVLRMARASSPGRLRATVGGEHSLAAGVLG